MSKTKPTSARENANFTKLILINFTFEERLSKCYYCVQSNTFPLRKWPPRPPLPAHALQSPPTACPS